MQAQFYEVFVINIKDVHYMRGVSINKDSTVVVVAIMTSCSFYEYHV